MTADPLTARILTLRVIFRDEGAAAEITPEMAAAYLTARGWAEVSVPADSKWRVFRTGDDETLVPRHPHWVDYGRRMVELVTDVALAESRSPLAVWAEMSQGEPR